MRIAIALLFISTTAYAEGHEGAVALVGLTPEQPGVEPAEPDRVGGAEHGAEPA